jgi:hypothetical protein
MSMIKYSFGGGREISAEVKSADIKRSLGYDQMIKNTERQLDALIDPDKYTKTYKTALKKIETDMDTEMTTYEATLDPVLTQDEKNIFVYNHGKRILSEKMQQFNIKFPQSLVNKTSSIVNTSKLMANPYNAYVGTARKPRRKAKKKAKKSKTKNKKK